MAQPGFQTWREGGARPSGGMVRNNGMGTCSRPDRQRTSAAAIGCVTTSVNANIGTKAGSPVGNFKLASSTEAPRSAISE